MVLLLALAGWMAGTPVRAAGEWNTIAVPIAGTVAGTPESVSFSGQATVASKIAPDPDFNQPTIMLTIDLGRVGGVGAHTRARYAISGPEVQNRSVTASDLLEFSFPFAKSGADLSETRSGTALFALTIDITTGAVVSARASIR
jgi:hypothetical protein